VPKAINRSQWKALRKALPPIETEKLKNWLGDFDPMHLAKLGGCAAALSYIGAGSGVLKDDGNGGALAEVSLEHMAAQAFVDNYVASLREEFGKRAISIVRESDDEYNVSFEYESVGMTESDKEDLGRWLNKAWRAVDVYFEANDLVW
jgi:hypothetical protein